MFSSMPYVSSSLVIVRFMTIIFIILSSMIGFMIDRATRIKNFRNGFRTTSLVAAEHSVCDELTSLGYSHSLTEIVVFDEHSGKPVHRSAYGVKKKPDSRTRGYIVHPLEDSFDPTELEFLAIPQTGRDLNEVGKVLRKFEDSESLFPYRFLLSHRPYVEIERRMD